VAYFIDDDEENQTARGQYGARLGGFTPTGGKSVTVSPQGSADGPSPAPDRVAGSRFVNFENYFSANRDAANRTANQIVGNVANKASNARDAVGNAEVQAMADVRNAGRAAPTVTGNDVKTASYTGPKEISETTLAPMRQSLTQAQSALNATNFGAPGAMGAGYGLKALIDDGMAGPSSNSRFDAMLAQRAGAEDGRFDALRSRFSNLGSVIGDAQGRVGAAATAAASDIEARNAAALGEADARARAEEEAKMKAAEKAQRDAAIRKQAESILNQQVRVGPYANAPFGMGQVMGTNPLTGAMYDQVTTELLKKTLGEEGYKRWLEMQEEDRKQGASAAKKFGISSFGGT
jgi:hypothetical protein